MPGVKETRELIRGIVMLAAGLAHKKPWTWFIGQFKVLWDAFTGAEKVIVEVPDMDAAEELEVQAEVEDALKDYELGNEDLSYIAKEAIGAVRHIVNIIVRLVTKKADSTKE
jgi:hypothetical protein